MINKVYIYKVKHYIIYWYDNEWFNKLTSA